MYLTHSISVLVPAYNEAPRISKILKSFLKSKLVDEIIVIDDGSADNIRQVVSRIPANITFLENKTNLGKASAIIKGVAKAKGDLIFMTDADYANLNLVHIDSSIKFAIKHNLDMLLLPTILLLNSVPLFDIAGSFSLLTGL